MRKTHYYHVYAVNDWARIAAEHIDALVTSGLYHELDALRVGVVGDRAVLIDVERLFCTRAPKAELVAFAREGWEQVTQYPMWHAAKEEDGLVLYAHTKGVWRQTTANEEWRAAMLRHLVSRWREATGLLSDRVQVIGSHRLDDLWPYEAPTFAGNPARGARRFAYQMHLETGGAYQFDPDDRKWFGPTSTKCTTVFAGNWWWSTMEWVRTMPAPQNNDRYGAEQWIGSTPGHRPRILEVQPGWPT